VSRTLADLRVTFIAGTLGQGGAERQLYLILRALVGCGTKLRLLTLTAGEFWEPRIAELGVPIEHVGASPSRWMRLARIVRAVRRERPDIVQSQHFYANLYAAAAGRLCGSPSIGAIRGNLDSEMAASGRLLGSLGLRLPTALAANSASACVRARDAGARQAAVAMLPNAVAVPSGAEPRAAGKPPVLLTAGRLVPQKRVDRLLRALGMLRARGTPFRAMIAGDGPERAALASQSEALKLANGSVAFVGRVDDLSQHYLRADLLVLTSDHEGTPNVVLEAMAYGLPVVATRVGGVPEVVEHERTGILVERDDEAGLASALQRLIEDPQARAQMGAAGRARVEALYSTEALPGHLARLYGSVLGESIAATR